MTVKEIPVNIRCLEYRQDKTDMDYGSCLYARFYFNLDKIKYNSEAINLQETKEIKYYLHLCFQITNCLLKLF